ncbi:MAG TPA: asparagine synthase-related protein [Alphaproteobacteria bacterium]|nr:asparagine synthase-related protein [Alphaproteobacteria bacterium]
MRMLGLWGAPHSHCAQLFSAIELDSGDPAQFHRILRPGAAALIRKGTAGISVEEAFDGFAVVDGDVFEPRVTENGGSAAALVLDLYRAYGLEALNRLESNAFIAIYDARTARVILARDRFGMGLGYWMERGDALLWSSELTTLLRCDPRTELDFAAIDQFLGAGRVTAPFTTLKHVHKLPSAHYLRADGQGIRTYRYWRQGGGRRLKASYSERLELLEHALLSAHRRQITPGKTAAALLSGGVDSMLMVALLARLGCQTETFTYRYTHYDGKFNESAPASRTAAWIGLRHQEMPVGPQDIATHFESILWQHQGPLTYGLHSAMLSAIAGSSVEVLYSGQGNGGPSVSEQIGLMLASVPGLGKLLAQAGQLPFGGLFADIAYIGEVAKTRLSWRFHSPLTDPLTRNALYLEPGRMLEAAGALNQLIGAVMEEYADLCPQKAFCGTIQRLSTADSSLQWAAAFARANGLLGRCPYYDRELIDLSYRLPSERDKRSLRRIAAKYLPRELAYAPKLGQTIPLSTWFQGPLADWLGERLSHERIRRSGLFRPEVVGQLYRSHLVRRGNRGWTLWSVAALVGWQEILCREAGRYTGRTLPLSAAG